MSDVGDDILVEAPAALEVAAEAPKGKISVEVALQVGKNIYQTHLIAKYFNITSIEKRSRS
jgi:hypothetical protein